MAKDKTRFDLAIVGGGLNGLATAAAVACMGLRAVHVAPEAPEDRRTSVLMGPSVDFLVEEGLVDDPSAIGVSLDRIRIIDATSRFLRAPETVFEASEAGLERFGWNFSNRALNTSFRAASFRAAADGRAKLTALPVALEAMTRHESGWRLHLADETAIEADLVVGADGKRSPVRAAAGIGVREHRFTQSALVCDLELGRPLENTSVEFHYPRGPFTLVPAGGTRANLVWIDDAGVLEAARAGGEPALLAAFADRSQRLFGTIAMTSKAFVFPLSTLSATTAGANGAVLVGESAHAFPPIGAQGLNLGLRDVADLIRALKENSAPGPGWAEAVSTRYAALRQADMDRSGAFVDTLFRSLLTDMLPGQALRTGGLWALKLLRPLRHRAFAFGMGGHAQRVRSGAIAGRHARDLV